MLTSNKTFRKSTLHLNSIVSSDTGKEQRLNYFHSFFAKARFSVTPNIYAKAGSVSTWDVMSQNSSSADIVLIGMQKPDENLEVFEANYFKMIEDSKKIAHPIFVICSEDLDISEIFN